MGKKFRPKYLPIYTKVRLNGIVEVDEHLFTFSSKNVTQIKCVIARRQQIYRTLCRAEQDISVNIEFA